MPDIELYNVYPEINIYPETNIFPEMCMYIVPQTWLVSEAGASESHQPQALYKMGKTLHWGEPALHTGPLKYRENHPPTQLFHSPGLLWLPKGRSMVHPGEQGGR